MINPKAYEILPGHMRTGMQQYIEHGIPPGDFLSAVLSNNFMEAFARADDINTYSMKQYAIFLYNYAPPGSYGSKENFLSWMERKGFGK